MVFIDYIYTPTSIRRNEEDERKNGIGRVYLVYREAASIIPLNRCLPIQRKRRDRGIAQTCAHTHTYTQKAINEL